MPASANIWGSTGGRRSEPFAGARPIAQEQKLFRIDIRAEQGDNVTHKEVTYHAANPSGQGGRPLRRLGGSPEGVEQIPGGRRRQGNPFRTGKGEHAVAGRELRLRRLPRTHVL